MCISFYSTDFSLLLLGVHDSYVYFRDFMRHLHLFLFFLIFFTACPVVITAQLLNTQPLIIDHNCTYLDDIPLQWVEGARNGLIIAYGHTSHGSQLITGMQGLISFKGDAYRFSGSGEGGALTLRDTPFSGAADLGNPDRTAWESATRAYLNNHHEVNVVIWSWCGQVGGSESDINLYLNLMSGLERDYPDVSFVYMTGHLDGSGASGTVNLRNEQIRNFCRSNHKILYDFADIESYDPDARINYMELMANDNCDYDSNGDGSLDRNWALDWQRSHNEDIDWYDCSPAHTQALNGNRKAYAAWWLWASLAGWNGNARRGLPREITVYQNYPNPFNPSTTISFSLLNSGKVTVKIYNVLGKEIMTLLDEVRDAGENRVQFSSDGLSSGVYFYRVATANNETVKKLIIMK
jgi:hypothetical protein